MRTSVQFSAATRSGVRAGRRNVVVYAHPNRAEDPSICGFIVSKAVGNAVTRNLVRRRLREISRELIEQRPTGYSLVLRALPPAAHADFGQLRRDVQGAWGTIQRRLDRREPAASGSRP